MKTTQIVAAVAGLFTIVNAMPTTTSQQDAEIKAQVDAQVKAKMNAEFKAKVDAEVKAKVKTQVKAKVDEQVKTKVNAQVKAKVDEQVKAKMNAEFKSKVDAAVKTKVNAQVKAKVDEQVKTKVNAQVKAKVDEQVKTKVNAQVKAKVDEQVKAKVNAQVKAKVDDEVKAKVNAQVKAKVDEQVKAKINANVNADVDGLVKVKVNGVSKGQTNSQAKGEVAAHVDSTINDGVILNYALTLEHLENAFYRTYLGKFSEQDFVAAGFDATFYANLKEIAFDEKTHVSFLTGALEAAGVAPVQECTYDFGVTSVASFIATASVLEGVGVSAYLGAAASIANKAYLTAAASVLTVEARHSSYLRAGLSKSPFPQAFDAPLDFDATFTLAAGFIKSCPKSSPALPLKAFPALSLQTTGTIKTGSTIQLSAATEITTKPLYACFVTVTGPICSAVSTGSDKKTVSTKVPAGVYGQSYVVLSSCDYAVTDDFTVAGPAIIEVAGTAGAPVTASSPSGY